MLRLDSDSTKRYTQIAPPLLFLFGIWYFCLRILGTQLDYIPGDLGDSRFINYLLEHGYCFVSGKVNSFWSADFMIPFQHTIALSDSMLGTQFFYTPWRWLGFTPETSYQLWWITICTLNFWFSYWAFHKTFKNPLLACILAWIFTFSIFNLGQLNYMQMIIRFPIPVAFYAAYRIAQSVSIKYLVVYCLMLIWQFYAVPYTGFYLFYFSILFLVLYFYFSKSFKTTLLAYFNKSNRIQVASIVLVTGLILAALFVPYFAMSKIVGLRLYSEILPNVPKLQTYILPHEASQPWNFLFEHAKTHHEKWWEMYLFP